MKPALFIVRCCLTAGGDFINIIPTDVPSERSVHRAVEEMGRYHRKKCKSNEIIKAECKVLKSDNLLKRDFKLTEPFKKRVTVLIEIKASNGKLYVCAIFGLL